MSSNQHTRASFLSAVQKHVLRSAVAAPTASIVRPLHDRPQVEGLETRTFLSAVTVTNFKSPVAGLGLRGIAVDQGGNLWFAEPGTGVNPGRIGEMIEDNGASGVPNGTFKQFAIPTGTNRPQYITAGPDGNMWFTESPGSKIGRITPAGVVTEFDIPTANAQPQKIIAASDGDLWFTEFSTTPSPGTSKIAKITTTGTITEYSTLFAPPPLDEPLGLVDRGDGNIWYVANGSSRVGFQGISSGTAGETSVPTANSGPFGIAAGSDNALWYTESDTDQIGRINNLFTAQTEYSLPTGTEPESIIEGPDNALYFTAFGTGKIGRIDPGDVDDGIAPTISFFANTGITANAQPTDLVLGADDNIYFTENGQDSIGRLNLYADAQNFTAQVTPSPTAGQAFSGEVATFKSDLPDSVASDFRANIDWGDGTLPTPGTIVKGANGQFFVSGTHTYANGTTETPDTLSVLLTRSNGRYPLTATTAVNVSGPGGANTPTLPAISIGDVSQSEGNNGTTAFSFTVTRTGDLTSPSSVLYSTADGSATVADKDYQTVSNTLAFNAGESSKTITVLVNGDTKYEPNETFVVNLSSPTGATLTNTQATGTIINDDAQAVLSVGNVAHPEGNTGTTAFTFTVTRTGNTTGTSTVNYATADGTAVVSGVSADYSAASGTLTFNPGDTTQTVTVLVNGDKTAEADETFSLNLSSPSADAALGTATGTGTIQNDDHAPVAATDTYSTPLNTTLTVAASGVLANDTDADNDPLTSLIVTNASHGLVSLNTNGSFTYTPINGYSGADSFTYKANDGANDSNVATVNLTVNAAPPPPATTLAISNASATEGNSGTKLFYFSITRSGDTTGTSTVHYATSDGTATSTGSLADYLATSGSVSFAPGQTTKNITVPVKGDTIVEANETFFVTLSAATNSTIATAKGTGTIVNDDAPPAKSKLSIGGVTATEGNSGQKAFTFNVTLDKSSTSPVTVSYSTADGTAKAGSDYKSTSGSLTFAAGQTVKTITVYVFGDTTKETNENFFVNLLSPVNADIAVGKGTGLIQNDD